MIRIKILTLRAIRWLIGLTTKSLATDPSFSIERVALAQYVLYRHSGGEKVPFRTFPSLEAAENVKAWLDAQAAAERTSNDAW